MCDNTRFYCRGCGCLVLPGELYCLECDIAIRVDAGEFTPDEDYLDYLDSEEEEEDDDEDEDWDEYEMRPIEEDDYFVLYL